MEHRARGDAHRDTLGAGHRLAEEHHAVCAKRDEHGRELHLPAHARARQRERKESADDDAAREPHMELVQARRLIVGIQRGDQGIARRLHRTVGDTEQQRAAEEAPVVPREDREQDAGDMPDERELHDAAHADGVAERSAEDHRQGESPEGGSVDPSDLLVVQAELGGPRAHGSAADGKAHGGDDECEATGGK